ncbi:MAG: type IV pilus assembly protein PilM [Syntrophomonadaceae bacterium]|nr:type IV pilus assembly protein PilM [Syntrophomonadaceae bacterium]
MFFKRKNTAGLGIDIGSQTIKAVEFENSGRGRQIKLAVRSATPAGTLVDGVIADASRLAAAIADLVERYGWQGRAAITAIGGRRVVTRHLRMPVMPEKELPAAVKWEAERHLPHANQEMVMDYQCLGEVQAEGNKQLLVLVATVPVEIARAYYDLFSAAHLKLVAIDLVPLALMRWATSQLGNIAFNAKSFAMAEIGAEVTYLAAVESGRLAFARTIPAGGAQAAKFLSAALKQSFPESRLWQDDLQRMKNSLPQSFLPLDEAAAALGETSLDFLLQNNLADLTRELRRSLDYYRAQAPNSPINSVLLTGGMALLPGLQPFLARELDRQVEIGVIHGQETDAVTLDPGFCLATGLALREVAD